MRIINTAKDNPVILDVMGRLAFYSGMDNLTLYEIRDGLADLMDENRWATYTFEMELQAALLEMSFNGIPVDQAVRNDLKHEFGGIVTNLTAFLNKMLEAIGYFDYYTRMCVHEFSVVSGIALDTLPRSWDEWKDRPIAWRREVKLVAGEEALKVYHKGLKANEAFNPNSPAQKLRLFYHFFGIETNSIAEPYFYTPHWLKTYGVKEYKSRKADGTYGPSADREALEKVIGAFSKGPKYAAHYATPFALVCLTIADLTKSLGFLKCRLDDGMFRSSFGSVTETGRLASRTNAMGFGSNGQNITPKLRHILTVEKDWKLSAPDYAQIESRIVAAICYQLFGLKNYIAGTECGDLHSLAASMVWDNLPWPKDFTIEHAIKHGAFPKDMLTAAKKIASAEFYRGKSRRDVSKTLGHGTSYMGKPPQMSKHSHIDVGLIVHYQEVFFEAFPEMYMWHNWVAEQVQTKGEITTMLGRSRRFFGRPNDDATLREAVAYEPQSVAADYTNTALLLMTKAYMYGIDAVRDKLSTPSIELFERKFPKSLPIKIFLQKHDELGYRYKQHHEEDVNLIVADLMEQHITLTSPEGVIRDWCVPVEMESGWNLGFRSKANPNGVGHPDSTLIRQQPKHWKEWKL